MWKLDRLGRSLRHLILTLDELHALGVGFVSLTEALDTTTPAGRFQMQILGAVAEFERGMIRERVVTGLEGAGRAIGTPQGYTTTRGCVSRSHGPASGEVVELLEVHRGRTSAERAVTAGRTNPQNRGANLGRFPGITEAIARPGQSGVCPGSVVCLGQISRRAVEHSLL